ncbi:hypothetical protein HanIR_Chr03g0116891 [Helianthus annuus]|nr:hypothetical protein HanIR_Chr03g0116891 [Helianthus annuus]
MKNYFCLKVHKGGWFSKFPDRIYNNGNIAYVDLLNKEKLCVIDVDSIAKELHYDDGLILHYHYLYLIPGDDLDFGLRPLSNHHDLVGLLKYLSVNGVDKEIDIYVEAGEANVEVSTKMTM